MNKEKTLNNELKVITSQMPGMESISIGVWIGTGGRYEDKKYCGISHFIEHMLFKGTYSRDARELKQAIEGVGGHFNGFTAEEVTCYLVKVPKKHFIKGLDVLSDMVVNPKMDQAEIEKERYVILEEIKMYRDRPSSYVHEILAQVMWPDHPLGRPLTGYEDTVSKITRSDLMEIKAKFYKPESIAVVACGKFEDRSFASVVKDKFSSLEGKGAPLYNKFKVAQREKKMSLYFKDTEQTHLAIGFHSSGRMDKRRYAIDLLNIILGGNMSSRLFEELREKRGLCYDVSSSSKKYEDTGAFFIHAGVDNRKVEETLKIITGELMTIKDKLADDDELNRAKEFYKGQLLLALEDTGSRMLWLGDKVMTEEGVPKIKDILERIDDVKPGDIKKAANLTFSEKLMNLSAIGPKDILSKVPIEKLMRV